MSPRQMENGGETGNLFPTDYVVTDIVNAIKYFIIHKQDNRNLFSIAALTTVRWC